MSSQQPRSRRRSDAATEYVGQSVPRSDAPAKVQGTATYTTDLNFRDMLHAKIVKSPHAHARITGIDTSAAIDLDGVIAIATADDTPDQLHGAHILDQPILAEEKVRYIGEPVAIVAAETKDIAEEAAQRVQVEYDRLDAVTDLDAAFAHDPEAVIHENVRDYEFTIQGDPRYAKRGHVDDEDADRPNLLYKDTNHVGDTESAFAEADHVVESEYEVKAFQHCAMEPHVASAQATGDEITIWASQQCPHVARSEICLAYPDIDPAKLTINTPFIGGGFGGKETPIIETRALAIAMKTDRPVKLQLSRDEVFTTTVSRPQTKVRVKDGVTADGDLIARETEIRFNVGAYNEEMFKAACSGPSATVGSYDIPNVRWESYAIYTNRPPYGAFRGFGKPEVNWGIERHMDVVAAEIGMDPLEYRANNLLREGDVNAKGETLGPNDTEGCLRQPVERLESIDVETEFPEYTDDEWLIGKGFAYGNKPVSRAAAAVTVYVKGNGTVEVHAGAPDIGQGSDTMLTQITAEEFGIDTSNVTLVTGDTNKTPYDRGPTGSRFTYHTGRALQKAIADVKSKMFDIAAKRFDDVDAADLVTRSGRIFPQDDPDQAIDISELFSTFGQQTGVSTTMLEDGGELVGTATFDARRGGEHHAFWTPVGQATLTATNILTGKTEVLWFCTAADVGTAINPKNVEQQIEGGSAQGISSAIYEEIVYERGQVMNSNFKDYRIPYATELPYANETIILESYETDGPYGAKGVGEMGVMAAAPAVGNAISNALNTSFDTIPITPERAFNHLPDL